MRARQDRQADGTAVDPRHRNGDLRQAAVTGNGGERQCPGIERADLLAEAERATRDKAVVEAAAADYARVQAPDAGR